MLFTFRANHLFEKELDDPDTTASVIVTGDLKHAEMNFRIKRESND